MKNTSDPNEVYSRDKFSYKLENPVEAKKQRERLFQDNSETYSFSLPKQLARKMNEAAAKNRVTRSRLIQVALEDFFENYE